MIILYLFIPGFSLLCIVYGMLHPFTAGQEVALELELLVEVLGDADAHFYYHHLDTLYFIEANFQ